MQFSVEVKRLREGTFFVCRGFLQQGKSSDYLFHLLTRPQEKTVVADVGQLTVDDSGLHVFAITAEFLLGSNRRLFLLNAPEAMLRAIRERHGVSIAEWSARPETLMAAKAVNGSAF